VLQAPLILSTWISVISFSLLRLVVFQDGRVATDVGFDILDSNSSHSTWCFSNNLSVFVGGNIKKTPTSYLSLNIL